MRVAFELAPAQGEKRRREALAISLILTLSASLALAKNKGPLSGEESAAITVRGRMLAEYEAAANHALEAIGAVHPDPGVADHYIPRKGAGGWVVAFGRFSDQRDMFLVAYEATPGGNAEIFTVSKNEPPKADYGYYYFAARAIDTVRRDFHGANRPYHAAVLPAESNQMYVYVFPTQTVAGVYPLGGDVRYLVSSDGSAIVERRQLHKTIIETRGSVPNGAKVVAGSHSHVLSDVPEDTDVYYVLTRKPSMPEYVGAGGHVYEIQEDGKIEVLK